MPTIERNGSVSFMDLSGKKASPKKTMTPAFFEKNILTGNGKSRGLLQELRNPSHYPQGYRVLVQPDCIQRITTNGDTTIYDIPFYAIRPYGWDDCMKTFTPETMASKTKIAANNNATVYLEITVQATQVEETKSYTFDPQTNKSVSSSKKDMSVCFHTFVFFEKDNTDTTFHQVKNMTGNPSENQFIQYITHNMYEDLRKLADDLNTAGYFVDKDTLADYFKTYDLYTNISKAADRIANHIDNYMIQLTQNIMKTNTLNTHLLTDTLANLEKYNIPIHKYHTMYNAMVPIVSAQTLKEICRANLNMMLSDTLHTMDNNRANLKFCPNNVPLAQTKTVLPYSIEQTNAIESTSPLTLVQSGAGTGKSTIILGRIQHMIDNGIDPSTILVLSFTNNAADHILDKNPNVKSMTIDKMMRLIYMANYNHQLSSISTIINSLDIYFDTRTKAMAPAQQTFIKEFAHILQRLRDKTEYTNALNFVRDHTDEVIAVLDTIQQTSLELQSIICYLKMTTLTEPAETKAEHLIIDEVQDNSIAQFIYCIKYTAKHFNSMYIVGDCSQTLYEFRASNPKALNMLEASGVFATYKLQTNYRSNQSILDFANIALANIEANNFAKIQLQSNSLAEVTPADFKQAVTVNYTRMPNKSEDTYNQTFEASINGMADWIRDKLMKGEQVAFLAKTHKDLERIERYLLQKFPACPMIDKATHQVKKDVNGNPILEQTRIVSLVPKRQFDNTVFSTFIAKYWNTVKYAPPTDIISTIECEMLAHASEIAYRSANASIVQTIISKTIADFRRECGNRIRTLQFQVQSSAMTQLAMLNEVKTMMLRYEIAKNSIAQAVMSARNNEARTNELRDNAHFIKSTVHSAKGLEFDNVVIYYDGASDENMDEPTKRLYYVALTRAKKAEYIFAYDRLAKPKIVHDYDRVVTMLEAIEKDKLAQAAAAAAGNSINPDDAAAATTLSGNNTTAMDTTNDSHDTNTTDTDTE